MKQTWEVFHQRRTRKCCFISFYYFLWHPERGWGRGGEVRRWDQPGLRGDEMSCMRMKGCKGDLAGGRERIFGVEGKEGEMGKKNISPEVLSRHRL